MASRLPIEQDVEVMLEAVASSIYTNRQQGVLYQAVHHAITTLMPDDQPNAANPGTIVEGDSFGVGTAI